MKKCSILIVLVIACTSINSFGQNIDPEWVYKYGGTGNDHGTSVVVDNNDNVLLLGGYSDSVDFDPTSSTNYLQAAGAADLVVQKINATGNIQWTRSIESHPSGSLIGKSMFTDANGNIFIIGDFTNSVDFDPGPGSAIKSSNGQYDNFVLKLDANGDFDWVKTYGSNIYDRSFSVTDDLGGNILITGTFGGQCDFDPSSNTFNLTSSGSDTYVLKLDSDGNFIWAKQFGGSGSIFGFKISTDDQQNVLVTGKLAGDIDFDPGTGTYMVSDTSGYVVKLDSSGTFLWVNHYGNDIRGLKNDMLGNTYIFGAFSGLVNFGNAGGNDTISSGTYSGFIQKLDTDGNNIWVKAIQTEGKIHPWSLHLDSNNDLFVSGSFRGITDFDPNLTNEFLDSTIIDPDPFVIDANAFALKLSNNGDFLWQKSLPGDKSSHISSVSTASNNTTYLVGSFESECDFGGGIGTLNSTGNFDMFIMKIGATASIPSESTNSNVNIFPNPTSGNVTISFEKQVESAVLIFDQIGKLVMSNYINAQQTTIDFSKYDAGIYTVQIKNMGNVGTFKIVKH